MEELEEMQAVFEELNESNKGMLVLLSQAIKLAQEEKSNVKENT